MHETGPGRTCTSARKSFRCYLSAKALLPSLPAHMWKLHHLTEIDVAVQISRKYYDFCSQGGMPR